MNTRNQNTGSQKPKRSRKKIFLLGLGALGLSLITFFSIKFWNKNKKENSATTETDTKAKTPNAKGGGNAKTEAKTSQSKSGQNKSTQTTPKAKAPKPINATMLAKAIHHTISKKDFPKSLLLLKAIKNTTDYSAVNKVFMQFLINGVRQTLVTGLLNTYTLQAQKTALNKSFVAIGLKYDGKKWSLSGVEDSVLLVTTKTTKVLKNPRSAVSVPANMVLGREIVKRGEHTLFENNNQYFLVETKAVRVYQPN